MPSPLQAVNEIALFLRRKDFGFAVSGSQIRKMTRFVVDCTEETSPKQPLSGRFGLSSTHGVCCVVSPTGYNS